jgi:D-glycero-alpha-D-manno-heptose 1-phosphate guanylyltransferase
MNSHSYQQIKTAIILAGGLGTRLREVVSSVPKPLAPVLNRPFVEHQMDYLIAQGVDKFILALGHLSVLIIEHFGDNYRGAAITYSIESKPLGTGGALSLAANYLVDSEVCLISNGDTFFNVDIHKMLMAHLENNSDFTFAAFRSNEFDRYMGLVVGENGHIKGFRSSKVKEEPLLVNGGVYLTDKKFLKKTLPKEEFKQSLETDIFPGMISAGANLLAFESDAAFIDIGIPADYAIAERIISAEKNS